MLLILWEWQNYQSQMLLSCLPNFKSPPSLRSVCFQLLPPPLPPHPCLLTLFTFSSSFSVPIVSLECPHLLVSIFCYLIHLPLDTLNLFLSSFLIYPRSSFYSFISLTSSFYYLCHLCLSVRVKFVF